MPQPTEREKLEATLFNSEGVSLINVKFFRGDNEKLSEEGLACEARRVLEQTLGKELEDCAPKSGRDRSQAAQLVENY